MRKVFDGKELNSIMQELFQLRRDCKPLIVQRTLMVYENHFPGVLESYEANVLFVINSMVGKDWPGYEVILISISLTRTIFLLVLLE